MCAGSKEGEVETYRRLLTEVYPTGIASIVSDTWDYWGVWTNILPQLRDVILQRDGKLVIRPDSGDPVKVICGDIDAPEGSPAFKGSFELAWELFGGTVTDKGYKVLDPHIGLIYGDSITLDRAAQICAGLMAKGFVPGMVLGIGSYTYQYNTRDTFGFAMKATACSVEGELREIFKDPKTDDGTKKSARGLLAVFRDAEDKLFLKQQASWHDVTHCEFRKVFSNGYSMNLPTLAEIRDRVAAGRL
jgi:nicotinamide phosphoribosyltransferase